MKLHKPTWDVVAWVCITVAGVGLTALAFETFKLLRGM